MNRLAVTAGFYVGGLLSVWAAPPVTDGLKFWVDASDASSLVTNATGKVSQWNDLSGGSHSATQGTPASQPAYNPTGLVGRASLSFTGSQFLMTAACVSFSNHTVFVVAQATATNESDILTSGTHLTAGDILLMNYQGKYRGHYWPTNNAWMAVSSTLPAVLTPVIYQQRVDDASLNLYRNGGFDAISAPAYPREYVTKPVFLGSRYADNTRSSGFKGELSEVLVYDRALTDAERMRVEEYLADKWLPPLSKPGKPPVTSGLKVWLDASDITALVTNGSGKVSQWNNQAMLWRHATQSTSGAQPLYRTNGLNRHPSLSFNGANVMSTPAFVNYSNHAVFVVAQATITNQYRDILGSGGTSPGDILLMNVLEGKYRGHCWPNGSTYALDSIKPSVTTPVIYEQTADNTTMRILRNGQLDRTRTDTVARTNALRSVCLGGRYTSAGSASFIGEMSEVLVYDRALSSNECVQVETYLFEKWLVPPRGTLIQMQ